MGYINAVLSYLHTICGNYLCDIITVWIVNTNVKNDVIMQFFVQLQCFNSGVHQLLWREI